MNCSKVDKLNLSNFDMSNVTNTTNMFFNCAKLKTLYLDNCSNDTISKIINSVGFPTGMIIGFGRPTNRKLYCKESEAVGLTLPTGWVFSYVRE
jgi:surface protein